MFLSLPDGNNILDLNLSGQNHEASGSDFPESLSDSDLAVWTAMTPAQRTRARRRLDAILAWQAGDITLGSALEASGLSRTRFYTVSAEFRASRTLASLGAFAGSRASRQRLDPEAVNALQAVVADVVAMNDGASVSELVRLLVDAADIDKQKLPGSTRLRSIVETELRRKQATGQVGHAVKLGLCAINLPRADGRPHILFTLIDEGTQLILGAWSGGTTNETEGYRHAARNALERISGVLSELKWAERLIRIDIEVGGDRERSAAFRSRLIEADLGAGINLAPTRYGRYFRKLIGPRIGRIEITPGRTEKGEASPDNGDMTPWTDDAARTALAIAVEQHNTDILGKLGQHSGRSVMPDGLAKALRILAK